MTTPVSKTVLLKDLLEGANSVAFIIEARRGKTFFCSMRTTKAQTSLRIRAV